MTCTLPHFLFVQEVRNLCGRLLCCALCEREGVISILSITATLTESAMGICELVYVAEGQSDFLLCLVKQEAQKYSM